MRVVGRGPQRSNSPLIHREAPVLDQSDCTISCIRLKVILFVGETIEKKCPFLKRANPEYGKAALDTVLNYFLSAYALLAVLQGRVVD